MTISRKRRHVSGRFAGVAAVLTGAIAAGLIAGAAMPPFAGYLAAVNVVTLLLYAYDKSAAEKRRLRVPEVVLHGLALAGGSPAALLGRHLLRHKTVKPRFRVVFWTIVLVQAALLLAWWRFVAR